MKNIVFVFIVLSFLFCGASDKEKMPRPVKPIDYEQFYKKIDVSRMLDKIFISVLVERDGSIQNPRIEKGTDKQIDKAAIEFVSGLKFYPAEINGVKIPMRITIPIPVPEAKVHKKLPNI